MTHFQVHVSVAAKAVAYSTGFTGSRQKISIWAPVARWKCIRAGTTFVSLKTIKEFSGSRSGNWRKTYSSTCPPA